MKRTPSIAAARGGNARGDNGNDNARCDDGSKNARNDNDIVRDNNDNTRGDRKYYYIEGNFGGNTIQTQLISHSYRVWYLSAMSQKILYITDNII